MAGALPRGKREDVSASLEQLIPELQEPARALLDLAARAGVNPRVTSTLRTRTEQTRLYRRYSQGLSRYPAAPPGRSAHEYGYAFDMVVVGDENQADLGTVWKSWGGIWGANDAIHFEYPGFSAPAAPEAEGRVGLGATLGDFLLSFAPFFGQVSLVASLVDLFGISHSAAVQWLSSPLSTFQTLYPEQFKLLEWWFTHIPAA